MENAGIRGIASDFVNSYLTNRNQIVNTGDHISDPKKNSCGFSQGNIIGPTLFLIYVSDFLKHSIRGEMLSYVDDTDIMLYKHRNMDVIRKTYKVI